MLKTLIGGSFLVVSLAACSHDVPIGPEANGTGGGTMLLTGAGAAHPGFDESGGSAGASPVAGKVVTADTDVAQYQSITVELSSPRPVLQGPSFVTDVLADNPVTLFTVTGTDCSAPQTRVLVVPSGNPQVHGIKLPISAGQSLCHGTTAIGMLTVIGFKPY